MIQLTWWLAVAKALGGGEPVFVSFVIAATKGSPGTPGAALAVFAQGSPAGTIGGGGMEQALVAEAKSVLASGQFAPRRETLHHQRSLAPNMPGRPSGLICGGSQTQVSLLLAGPADALAAKSICQSIAAGIDATFLLSTNGLVFPAHRKQDTRADWQHQIPLLNPRRIAIFGGGHCGVALATTMLRLDYVVHVFERRDALYTLAGLPSEIVHHTPDLTQAAGRVAHPGKTMAVVMTSDFPSDVAALTGILRLPFPFIGVMGSPQKLAKIHAELANAGFSADSLSRLTAPVGLDIGSDTPEEIAISVAAQILLVRRNLT